MQLKLINSNLQQEDELLARLAKKHKGEKPSKFRDEKDEKKTL